MAKTLLNNTNNAHGRLTLPNIKIKTVLLQTETDQQDKKTQAHVGL